MGFPGSSGGGELFLVLGLKTLRAGPRFQQRTVHAEVLVRRPSLFSRLRHHPLQKFLGYLGLQQPVAVLGKHRRIPHRIIQIQPHKPAEQHVVVHLFHQQPLAAHRIQHLQQLCAQQLLRRNRRATHFRVHLVELRRKLLQDFIHHRADRTQRMIFAHSLLWGNVAEHVTLLLIGSSHAPLDASRAASLRNFRVFQQPASVVSHK